MNRPYKRNERNVKSRFLFFLLAPMLLIPLSAFGYAQWNHKLTTTAYLVNGTEDIEITAWHIISTNSYDVDCDEVILGDELKIENVYDSGQVVELRITADPIFPEWELELVIEIHNPAQEGNLALYLSSEIQHEGVTITEAQLLDLFRIKYTDGFYLDPDLNEPVPDLTTWQLWPGDSWYKLEHLIFDAQEHPELQGQSFTFQVIIYGTAVGGP